MKFSIFCLITFSLGLAALEPAFAKNASSEEKILKAWLSSPHADAKSESFRHWDKDKEIMGACAVCHSTTGVVKYLNAPITKPGVIDHPVPIGVTIECAACHSDGAKKLKSIVFPSNVQVSVSNSSAICSVCHQGRASMIQVNDSVAKFSEDDVSKDIKFINVHYSAAAATQLGSEVKGGYQYPDLNYAGAFKHVPNLNTCVACHDPHTTKVELGQCTACHQDVTDFRAIRTTPLDILGDSNKTAGIGEVITQLHDRLDAAIRIYATQIGKKSIVYSEHTYPYYFNDLDESGIAEEAEAAFPNRYQNWTPRLLKAAYNYQFVAKDKGAFSHNPHYVIQLMIDSIRDLAKVAEIDIKGLDRP